ncbi:hypothetical protein, partial [Streptomyces violascens]|uniref:hypothetical protein n=1 Tax=Streptomyces violascens TaxID=67381 RepID=UPI0036A62678
MLSISDQELRSIRRGGRVLLDTPHAGQRAFQALLFGCSFNPVREHPFDRHRGRSFVDLQLCFGSLTPLRDRLVISSSTAARVARFLVPAIPVIDHGTILHAGLPRLRLET